MRRSRGGNRKREDQNNRGIRRADRQNTLGGGFVARGTGVGRKGGKTQKTTKLKHGPRPVDEGDRKVFQRQKGKSGLGAGAIKPSHTIQTAWNRSPHHLRRSIEKKV